MAAESSRPLGRGVLARVPVPCALALAAVGLCLGGLLVGYEPVGGDPDGIYRPIKTELSRALRQGTLPFWSDRLGLGVPLVAESHVAAFYPSNLVLYRVFETATAYRLSMWLHFLAVVVAMYAYARELGITPWGASISSLALALSGFQSSHSCHEPFYHVLPYLPFCLLLAERFMASGGVGWLAGLALALGVQVLLGHFQIQMWTAGLVVLTGFWRAAFGGRPWPRALALSGAVAWGFGVAAVSLGLTWELIQVAKFDRPLKFLMNFAFPLDHWAQLALPRVFLGFEFGNGVERYWDMQGTLPYEAALYVGTVPLVLAFVGLLAWRDRPLAVWRLLVPLSFALATMPRWWPDGYMALLQLPGLGYFRAPARYTLLTSVGLALLAGRGFDRLLPSRRFWTGFALASAFAAAAGTWGWLWMWRPEIRQIPGHEARMGYLAGAAGVWVVSLAVLAFWRLGYAKAYWPFVLAALELGYLFHHGATPWGWGFRLPEDSPAMARLLREPGVELVAGRLMGFPARAGLTPAYPTFGINAPPPNYLLEGPSVNPTPPNAETRPWLSRFGVTHGIWKGEAPVREDVEILYRGKDPALDKLQPREPAGPEPSIWRVERYPPAAPPAHVATQVREAKNWYALYARLSKRDARDEVWFERAESPHDDLSPRARQARLLRWDSVSGEVEHDGTCDLVIRRTYYPGWTAQLNDGPEEPVYRADGGLQAVRIPGSGRTRVTVRYRPTLLSSGAVVSAISVASALAILGLAALRARRSATSPPQQVTTSG